MLRADILQLHKADGGIDPAQQEAIALYDFMLGTAALFEIQHILRVLLETLPVVGHITLLNGPLKIGGGFLCGLFHLPLRHAGSGRPCLGMPDLLTVAVSAGRDEETIGDAGLAVNPLYARHLRTPLCCGYAPA